MKAFSPPRARPWNGGEGGGGRNRTRATSGHDQQASATRSASRRRRLGWRLHGRDREMSETLKAAVREFYERGWNRGDLSVIEELFSPEYQDHDAAAQTGTGGLDGARQFIETFRAAIPNLHVAIEDQYAEGSVVTTRWKATGTHGGTLMGVPATNRHVEVSGISIDRSFR